MAAFHSTPMDVGPQRRILSLDAPMCSDNPLAYPSPTPSPMTTRDPRGTTATSCRGGIQPRVPTPSPASSSTTARLLLDRDPALDFLVGPTADLYVVLKKHKIRSAVRKGSLCFLFFGERERRAGARLGPSRGGWWVGRVLFLWFSRSLCFLFYLSLRANARWSRTQPGRFVTCVGGGHGAR